MQRIGCEFLVTANVLVVVEEDEGARLVIIEDALILAGNSSQVLLPLGLKELEDLDFNACLRFYRLGSSDALMEVSVSYHSCNCYL